MRIHHYTTIDTLALILKNKTIRFNRLDKVDDLEENITANGVKIGQYSFVSCWTEDESESIPLWKLYTGSGIGVRISLEHEMFKVYNNEVPITVNGIPFDPRPVYTRTITPLQDFINAENVVFAVAENEIPFVFKKVQYVLDVNEHIRDLVVKTQHPSNILGITVNTSKFGLYKQERWSFEKESRFVLIIVPGRKYKNVESFMQGYNGNNMFFDAWNNGIIPSISYYDMHLKDNVFDGMEITLSPAIPEPSRIIVESLVKQYAPQATIRESSLEGKVRLK